MTRRNGVSVGTLLWMQVCALIIKEIEWLFCLGISLGIIPNDLHKDSKVIMKRFFFLKESNRCRNVNIKLNAILIQVKESANTM